MPAGQVRGPRGDPTRPANKVSCCTKDGSQTRASRRWKQSLSKIYRECRYRVSGGPIKERKESLESGGFYWGQWSNVHVLLDIQEQIRTKMKAQVLFLGARGLGVEMSISGGVEYTYDRFIWSFSPGPSLDVISSREIISSLSLTRRTYAICITRHVSSGMEGTRS